MPGTLFLVATPIGNLEDMTIRGLRVLKEADLVAAEDTRHTAKLLSHYGITTRTISLHEHNERHQVPKLLDEIAAGRTVAVVTDAGMPAISDPGFLVVREAVARGLPVAVIPGASALTAALAGSALPANIVTFLGFPPSRSGERKRWLRDTAANAPGTLVLYESPMRLGSTLEDLREILHDRHAVIARELTKLHESWHRGSLSELARAVAAGEIPSRGECVILVSDQIVDGDVAIKELSDADVVGQFSHLTNIDGLSRREALSEVADRTKMSKRAVYALIERAKVSGS